jgi:6-phosphogluconolactonase
VSVIVVADRQQLADRLAGLVEDEASQTLAGRPLFALALPGGSVATACFPRLAHARVDWSRTHVFWVDERAVPPDDPESNYGVARSLLLDPVAIAPDNVHRMTAEASALDAAATAYSDELVRVLGAPPRLDLALLGVGPDGHIASLFPGQPIEHDERWAVAIEDAPKPPPRRLTLTLPVLALARRIVVVAMGDSKAAAIAVAIEQPRSQLPLAILLRRAPHATLLLDEAAACGLRRR